MWGVLMRGWRLWKHRRLLREIEARTARMKVLQASSARLIDEAPLPRRDYQAQPVLDEGSAIGLSLDGHLTLGNQRPGGIAVDLEDGRLNVSLGSGIGLPFTTEPTPSPAPEPTPPPSPAAEACPVYSSPPPSLDAYVAPSAAQSYDPGPSPSPAYESPTTPSYDGGGGSPGGGGGWDS